MKNTSMIYCLSFSITIALTFIIVGVKGIIMYIDWKISTVMPLYVVILNMHLMILGRRERIYYMGV